MLAYNTRMATHTDMGFATALRALRRLAGVCTCVLLAGCATADVDADTTSAALQADGNGDRNVTCEEWRRWMGATFDAKDADRSGHLSAAEFEAFVVQTGLFQSIPLTRIDGNADQRYSRDEITVAGTKVFEDADRNSNCVLSRRELNVPKARDVKVEKKQPEAGPNPPDGGTCKPPLCQ